MPLTERKTIGMDALRRHLWYIILSGFIKDERALSTLIVAFPERAKSVEVVKISSLGCLVFNDLTAYGLSEVIVRMSQAERETFHHLIIPDLERIGARSRTVRQELLATLQVAMQEGLTNIRTHFVKLECDPPMRLGLIAATTPQDLGDRRSVFRRVSFLSRLIPFSYDFSDRMKVDILNYVKQDEHLKEENFRIRRRSRTEISVPNYMKDRLVFYAKLMSRKIEHFATKKGDRGELVGIRSLEHLICYLKAIALSNNRQLVVEEDFRDFEDLFKFFNFDFNDLEYQEEVD